MANENNNGAAKLKQRILDAAHAEASEVAQKAAAERAEIQLKTERQLEQAEQLYASQREDAVKAIIERSRTNAELTARKEALAARREVIDRVFAEAYQSLCAMDDKSRAGLCRKLLLAEAEGGETVFASKNDAALLEGIINEISTEFKKSGKQPLQFSKEPVDIEYGFVLKGAAFEKDCSFHTLLRDARASEETGVAKILFG